MNSQHIAQSIWEVTQEGMPLETALSNTKNMLKKHNALPLYPKVLDAILRITQTHSKSLVCEVLGSQELSGETKKQIAQKLKLSESFDDMEVRIDESLIGGFIATYKGIQYDMSVRNNLQKVKRKLGI